MARPESVLVDASQRRERARLHVPPDGHGPGHRPDPRAGLRPAHGRRLDRDPFERLPGLVSKLLPEALARVESGDRGDPQSDEDATYAALYEDDYAEIDWTRPAREIHNQVRSWFLPTVSGITGPLTTLDGERVRVLATKLVDGDAHGEPGMILERGSDGLLVACGDGPIRVLGIEPAS